jgi:hypothetical protein
MVATNYAWDPEFDCITKETDAATGAINVRYTQEPRPYGGLVSQRRGSATSYYHYDPIGTTRALTNQAQSVTDRTTYTAFGELVDSTGTTVNPFGYYGSKGVSTDNVIEAALLRYRHYEFSLSRYCSLKRRYQKHCDDSFIFAHNRPGSIPPNLAQDDDEIPPDRVPGTFNVFMGACEPDWLRKGCCCTAVQVDYNPSDVERFAFPLICLMRRASTAQLYACGKRKDPTGYNFKMHDDPPSDEQLCAADFSFPKDKSIPYPYRNYVLASVTDFPGAEQPNCRSNLISCPACDDLSLQWQVFEVCAIGKTLGGNKMNLGCVRFGHSCDFSYSITKIKTNLEPLTKPDHVVHTDERAAYREEGLMNIGASFIACPKAAELMQPGQGSFNHPARLTKPASVSRILMCDDWLNSSDKSKGSGLFLIQSCVVCVKYDPSAGLRGSGPAGSPKRRQKPFRSKPLPNHPLRRCSAPTSNYLNKLVTSS